MNVCVFQWPKGARAFRRSPRSARPRRRVILVVVAVSSMKTSRSTGIAAIVHAYNEFAEQGGRLAVYAPADQVLRVLSVTGLTSNGMVFDSAEEALSAFVAVS